MDFCSSILPSSISRLGLLLIGYKSFIRSERLADRVELASRQGTSWVTGPGLLFGILITKGERSVSKTNATTVLPLYGIARLTRFGANIWSNLDLTFAYQLESSSKLAPTTPFFSSMPIIHIMVSPRAEFA